MTYKCMSRMYAYGCQPRSYYQHNVPNSGFSLFFLSFSFFFISALIMSRSWSTWIQHHKKHQPHSFWVEVNTNTNLTNTAIENTERLLSPRLSCGTPPGSGMFCVPSSYPSQVFSCCKWAAVGLLCPFPILSKEQAQSQATLQVSSNPQATSCSPRVSASHTAPTRLCSAEGRGTMSKASRRKENQLPIHFLAVPASHVPEVCEHTSPPHWADPVSELLKGFKHQLPREVSLIFVYKASKQKG